MNKEKCPNCKKDLVYAFFNNMLGGDNLKCNNKKCKFYGVIRQIDVKDTKLYEEPKGGREF